MIPQQIRARIPLGKQLFCPLLQMELFPILANRPTARPKELEEGHHEALIILSFARPLCLQVEASYFSRFQDTLRWPR